MSNIPQTPIFYDLMDDKVDSMIKEGKSIEEALLFILSCNFDLELSKIKINKQFARTKQ